MPPLLPHLALLLLLLLPHSLLLLLFLPLLLPLLLLLLPLPLLPLPVPLDRLVFVFPGSLPSQRHDPPPFGPLLLPLLLLHFLFLVLSLFPAVFFSLSSWSCRCPSR